MPTDDCYKKSFLRNLSEYDLLTNDGQKLDGDVITTFFEDQLGLYPYLDGQRKVNDGIPQVLKLLRKTFRSLSTSQSSSSLYSY